MILSTCGASAVVFHTTSLFWRAAWARRTNHQGAVVTRMAAVLPACCKMSRRVSIFYLRAPLHAPALEEQKHAHRQQGAVGHGQGISVTASPTPPDTAHRSPPPSCAPLR